ncbi:MAG: diacylglycerol kinase family protein [Clostridia bacterium]|nr:diacylglycerol kinase family protein [Clostridia bacterium]
MSAELKEKNTDVIENDGKKRYVIFNPHSGNSDGEAAVKYLSESFDNLSFLDITSIGDYSEFLSSLGSDDEIVLCGGDGTLNRFINETRGIPFSGRIAYLPKGNGNDFARDVKKETYTAPFYIDSYIDELPTVTVKGKDYYFINGVGYGVDGYCCEVGDKLKAEGKKPNYTAIAIKGLLFHYKPTNATITVDGTPHSYKKVWIAPTMFGRYYGGGMMPTPDQRRDSEGGTVSAMSFHGCGKLRVLTIFPSIFKGEHVKHKKQIDVLRGKKITVKFDSPRPLQIDGETILDVTEYTVKARN